MPDHTPPLTFDTGFDPQAGSPVELAPGLVRITAANAGPYTFTGTNSFLLGKEAVAVVDPGPDDDTHLTALLSAIGGRQVEAIILTHTHNDHCALVPKLAAKTRAPLWSAGPHRLPGRARPLGLDALPGFQGWRLTPDRLLRDGEFLTIGGVAVEVLGTPGHCANHIAFGLSGTPVLLTGDHVMGWSSTLVAAPDGSMLDYFTSLDRVIASTYTHFVPAHGGPVVQGKEHARALKAHRQMRNGQILAAVAEGADTVGKLLWRIYPDLKPALRIAARMTLRAHIEYLRGTGQLKARRGIFGPKFGLS